MRVAVLITMFLSSYLLLGCDVGDGREPPSVTQNALPRAPGAPGTTPQASGAVTVTLSALTADEAENFVQSWCGSGVY